MSEHYTGHLCHLALGMHIHFNIGVKRRFGTLGMQPTILDIQKHCLKAKIWNIKGNFEKYKGKIRKQDISIV